MTDLEILLTNKFATTDHTDISHQPLDISIVVESPEYTTLVSFDFGVVLLIV